MGSRSRPRRSRRRAVTVSRRGKRSPRPTARKAGARRKAARGPAAFKNPGLVVSTEWLASNLEHPRVRVVDGTWHMPQLQRDARREFEEAHVPVAVFDGGLRKGKAENRPLATGAATPAARRFRAKIRPALVRGIEQMRRNI